MPGQYGKPLITQRTDLKTLKYTTVYDSGHTVGKDPYVTKTIPQQSIEETSPGVFEGTTTGEPRPEASSIIGARLDDVKRLSSLLKLDSPVRGTGIGGVVDGSGNGLIRYPKKNTVKFATNQAILGQTPKQIAMTIGSALAQAPVNGTGTHFTHGFVVDTYLKKDVSQKTALGRFLAEQLDINAFQGAPLALTGKTIIPNNEGQENFRPHRDSDLVKLNSKYDLSEGATDFSTTLLDKLRVNPYVDTVARGFEAFGIDLVGKAGQLLKGKKSVNDKAAAQGEKPKLGNIFKLKGDNLGQENFQPLTPSNLADQESDEIHDSIQSNLKGSKDPSNHLTTGADDLEGRTLVKGGQKRVIRENNGGRGFTPQTPDFLSKKESEQTINVNGKETPLKPDLGDNPGLTPEQISDQTVTTPAQGYNEKEVNKLATQEADTVSDLSDLAAGSNPRGPSTTGRIMPQIGPDGVAEGEFRTFVDNDGGITGVVEREYDPNNPSQLKMYLQDQPGITESEDLKTELGGQVSSGDTSTGRITKLIDFRKVRKYGVNAGVHGKTESIGPDSNGYSSNTPTDLLPDYTTQEVGVRLKYAKKGQADYVNATDIIDASIEDSFITATENYFDSFEGDIIPFEFNTITPNKQQFLFFRAFLDDFSDNYTGEWNGDRFIGRAEEFYTYQGFSRDIAFSFKVAAFSKEELVPLYKKLNALAGSTAPTYDGTGNFMRGTLCTLTLGEYLDRQDGFITKVGLTWEKGYPWEIDLFNENVPKVPTILNVSVSFTPIHNFNVKSDLNFENLEQYFGANFIKREPVERVSTVKPRPATVSTRPEAEIPKIPKSEPVATPVPTLTPTPPAPVAQKIETPIAKTNTVQPTTTGIDGAQVGSNLDKSKTPSIRKVNTGFTKKFNLVDSGRATDTGEYFATYTYEEKGSRVQGEGDGYDSNSVTLAQRKARQAALADFKQQNGG